jgi:hypothetical protein
MSQHDDFLEGFADAMGLSDPEQIQGHYQAWLASMGMSSAQRIDLEGGGYETGLEAGNDYRKQCP